ncbi:hypothetical protein G6F57_020151 [Rhizopus arrhizus]|nr:hypothetical protein G6F57_020151 [Rhizopus arrhizus]
MRESDFEPAAEDGRHARIVPAVHVAFLHQLQQLALAGDDVAHVQAGEFILVRQRLGQLAEFGQAGQDPVVERPLVFEFQRADAVRDAFQRVFHRVRPAVHRVDAPLVARAVVGGVAHAVHDRVAKVDVGDRKSGG